MYLKKLEILGFKSFAQRTELEFSPGVTAIVGPNGSGKSNIADAVRWVLGEQSIRQIRGRKSEDIIFAGSQGKSATGMAEVTLTLDNSTNWLPLEYTEVTITRRCYRSGENEYLINRQKVRLKDITMLLGQAKIGPDSYTVIGQGMIDAALSLRAEDRRSLFEDAAGIKPFKVQRDDAENKLEQIKQNLNRVEDIISEIEPRIGPMSLQAKRAVEYKDMANRLQGSLREFYGLQVSVLQNSLDDAKKLEEERKIGVETLKKHIDEIEQHLNRLETQRIQIQNSLSSSRHERGRLLSMTQEKERHLAVQQERLSGNIRQRAAFTENIKQLQEQLLGTQLTIQQLTEDEALLSEQIEDLKHDLEKTGLSIQEYQQAQKEKDEIIRACQRAVIQSQSQIEATQSSLTRMQNQHKDYLQQQTSHSEIKEHLKVQVEVLKKTASNLQNSLDGIKEEENKLKSSNEILESESEKQQAELQSLKQDIALLQQQKLTLTEKLNLLESWKSSLGGFNDGVKTIVKSNLKNNAVIGLLSEILTVQKGLETAIEAALGNFTQAIVIKSEDDIETCFSLLSSQKKGKALLIWESEQKQQIHIPDNILISLKDDIIGAALDLVEFDKKYKNIVVRALGNTIVVKDSTKAKEIVKKLRNSNQSHINIVTTNGEVINLQGWAYGGVLAKTTPNILEQEREIKELPGKISELEKQEDVKSKVIKLAELTSQNIRNQIAENTRNIQGLTNQYLQSSKELEYKEKELNKTLLESGNLEATHNQVNKEIEKVISDSEIAKKEIAKYIEELREAQEQLVRLEAETKDYREVLSRQQELHNSYKTEIAVRNQKVSDTHTRITHFQANTERNEKAIISAEQKILDMEKEISDIEEDRELSTSENERLRLDLQKIEEGLKSKSIEINNLDQKSTDLNQQIRSSRSLMTAKEDGYREALLAVQRLEDQLASIHEKIKEDLEEGLPEEVLSQHYAQEEAEQRINILGKSVEALRSSLKRIGGYDPEIIQQYEEIKTRYEFLKSQISDMEHTATSLHELIEKLDKSMEERFQTAFKSINEHFKKYFAVLFRGGQACLEISRNSKENSSEASGIEIWVQPPGKKVQELSLLSGGERSLVSASLIFALLETNPPPFCLMDEVDAALDESNIVRFCDILKSLSEHTQFIMITHNRVTMTVAQAIYGVSMGQDSISRMLSMRLAEIPA